MDEYQRTTIRLPKELHLACRIKALKAGITLTDVVTYLLVEWVGGGLELPGEAGEPETAKEQEPESG